MTICNNCNDKIENKYCGSCGQSLAMNGKINAKEFVTEIFHSIFHTGGGLFYTLKLLFSKPEIVFSGYLSGKRKKYFSPIKLFLITGVIYISANHYVNKNIIDNQTQTLEYYFEHYKYLMIFGPVIIMAFLNWLIYKKKKLTFTENFVIGMYIQSALYLFNSLFMLINNLANLSMLLVGIIIGIFYYSFSTTRFYNKNKVFGSVLNAFISVLITLLFLTPIILNLKK